MISLGQTQPGQLLKAGLEITKPALRDQEGPKAPPDRGYLSCIIPPPTGSPKLIQLIEIILLI